MSSSLFSITSSIKPLSIINEYIKDPKYKTEMCKNWERIGSCSYNIKCRFAHGKNELMSKELEIDPNYKAKDCLNFFKYGFCYYGRRCCFRHDERRIIEKNACEDIKLMLNIMLPTENKRLLIFEQITLHKRNRKRNSKISAKTVSTCFTKNSNNKTTNETYKKSLESSFNDIEEILNFSIGSINDF
jgi:hypothetical protein